MANDMTWNWWKPKIYIFLFKEIRPCFWSVLQKDYYNIMAEMKVPQINILMHNLFFLNRIEIKAHRRPFQNSPLDCCFKGAFSSMFGSFILLEDLRLRPTFLTLWSTQQTVWVVWRCHCTLHRAKTSRVVSWNQTVIECLTVNTVFFSLHASFLHL